MKNSILIFLLGIFVTISIAATTPNTGLFTVKKAPPKSIFVKYCYTSEAEKYVKTFITKGYIFISFSGAGSTYGLLVMEKY